MTNLDHGRNFDAALNECAERVRTGEDLTAVLADYPPEYRGDLAELVPLTTRIGGLASDPSPRFVDAFESRLLDAADHARAVQAAPGLGGRLVRAWRRSMLVKVAATAPLVLVLLFSAGATAVEASRHALPGSPLYTVREAREWSELRLARNTEARVATLAAHVDDNSADLERALRSPDEAATLEQLGRRALAAARTMVDEALDARAAGDGRATVRALAALRQLQQRVDTLEATATPEQRPLLARLRAALREQADRLAPVRPAPTPIPGGRTGVAPTAAPEIGPAAAATSVPEPGPP